MWRGRGQHLGQLVVGQRGQRGAGHDDLPPSTWDAIDGGGVVLDDDHARSRMRRRHERQQLALASAVRAASRGADGEEESEAANEETAKTAPVMESPAPPGVE